MEIFNKEVGEITWSETINRLKYHRVCIGIDDLLDGLMSKTKNKGITWSIRLATGYYLNCSVLQALKPINLSLTIAPPYRGAVMKMGFNNVGVYIFQNGLL